MNRCFGAHIFEDAVDYLFPGGTMPRDRYVQPHFDNLPLLMKRMPNDIEPVLYSHHLKELPESPRIRVFGAIVMLGEAWIQVFSKVFKNASPDRKEPHPHRGPKSLFKYIRERPNPNALFMIINARGFTWTDALSFARVNSLKLTTPRELVSVVKTHRRLDLKTESNPLQLLSTQLLGKPRFSNSQIGCVYSASWSGERVLPTLTRVSRFCGGPNIWYLFRIS